LKALAQRARLMIYLVGDAEIDTATREIRRGGVAQFVEPKVFDFVEYLIRFRDRLVAKDELLNALWGGRALSDSVIARAAHAARRLLADPTAIKTLYGKGYRFVGPLVERNGRALTDGRDDVAAQAERKPARSNLIGRRDELNLAASCLEEALAGAPRTLLVTGEAGIGKTAFCERVATLTSARGGCALWGKCSEVPGAPPYWPFIQLLRDIAMAAERAAAVKGLLADHPEVRNLVAARDVSSPPGGDHEHGRFRLFDEIARFLRGASRIKPLALLLDDLHCADTPSLLLFHFLVHHLVDARVLVLAAYRDAEMRASTERARWGRDIALLPGVSTCRLSGLGRDEVQAFVRCATGEAASKTDLDYLFAQTAGNPFYLSQLTPLLGQSIPAGAAAERGNDLALPRSVLDAIGSHLGALAAESRRALDAAAVIGREFDLGLLSSVLGIEKPEVLGLLAVPLDSGLLQETSVASFRFAHVLIRDVLYRALPAQARSDWHRRAGESLERTLRSKGSVESALAHHFTEASTTTTAPKAIHYSVLSGELALKRLAYEEAAVQFGAAVKLHDEIAPDDDHARCELLLKLGAAQVRSGNRHAASITFRRAANVARQLGVPARLAEAALDLAPGFFSIETGVVDEYLVEQLEEALLLLGDTDPLLRARLLGRLAAALYWKPDHATRREALCDEVTTVVHATSDPAIRLCELASRHAAIWTPDNLEDRLRWSTEAAELSERLGDAEAQLVATCFKIVDRLQAGEMKAVRGEMAIFKRLAVAARQPECLWLAEMYDCTLALLRGEFARVERFGLESIGTGTRFRYHDAIQSGGLYVALSRMELGRAAEVMPDLDAYVQRYPNVPWEAFMTFAASRAGDREVTRTCFDRAVPLALTQTRDNVWFATMVELCESALFLGAREEASALHDAFAPYAGMFAVIGYGVGTYGSVARYLGQLSLVQGKWTDAIGELETGIDANRKIGGEPLVAHGCRELSMALLGRSAPGDRRRAELLAQEAAAIAERLDMVWLLAQLRTPDA
jgi:DNA-binding winged helix-turn-helix (wHTH) protein